jgi:hypothetical protein
MSEAEGPAPEIAAVLDDETLATTVELTQPKQYGGGKIQVPVEAEVGVDLQKVLEAAVFVDWLAQVEANESLYIMHIHIQSVDMFGPRVGFLKFKARALVDVGERRAHVRLESALRSALGHACHP